MIELRHVCHHFPSPSTGEPGPEVVSDVSLDIATGSVVSFLGPSGCGKTTLLRILAGLMRPTQGEVRVGDQALTSASDACAMVFQEFNLLPWRTALQNVELPLELRSLAAGERRRQAAAALAQVGLAGFESFYPKQLSGGMKQRVGIARALVTGRPVLVCDEPFAALDPLGRELMQIEFLRLLKPLGKTIVFVTHSVDEAVFLSDVVVVFSARPARVRRVCDIVLPEPRWEEPLRIRGLPAFIERRDELWSLVRQEVTVV